jgi:hypothetical protein
VSDIDSGSVEYRIGIGSFSGLKSFGLWFFDGGDVRGAGDEDILRRREKSSGSASARGAIVCGLG